MAKKAPVTSARTRQERIKNRGKAPASTPKGRQTTAMQRPFKPGTKTSNTTTKFAGQKSLPAAGQSGGSQSPKGTTTPRRGGPVRTPAQLAMERRSAAASKRAAANLGKRASNAIPKAGQGVAKAGGNFRAPGLPKGVANAVKGATKLGRGAAKAGNIRSAIVGAIADRTLGPLAQRAGTALGKGPLTTLGRAIDDRLPGINSKDEARRKAAAAKPKAGLPALKGSMVNGKIQMTQVAKPKKPAAKPAAPKAATAPTRSSAPSRSSAPARTTASRPAAKPAAKPKAPASMATESSLSAADIMKGYGMRVNQTFGAESPSAPKKRQSLREQTADIKKMIEASKKRQGKG